MMIQINPDAPVVALTATATPKVQSDIIKNLDLRGTEYFYFILQPPEPLLWSTAKIKKAQTDENIVHAL